MHTILGMPSIHNPAWALIQEGRIVVSIEEDRLHRQKNRFGIVGGDGRANVLNGLSYCLDAAGITSQDIDDVAFGFNPSSLHQPGHMDYRQEKYHHERVFRQQQLLLDHLRRSQGCQAPAYYIRHHLAHAASVYFTSPYEEATIITIDGWGEDETISVCRAQGAEITTLAVVTLPNSLGELYTDLTTRLGWGKDDAGKTMGLASYGHGDTSWKRLIRHGTPADSMLWVDTSEAMAFVHALPQRHSSDPIEQQSVDAAARIQFELEESLLYVANWAFSQTHQRNLCLAGGVALNSVANYRLLTETCFEHVFVQPACGDSGVPAGAALGLYFHLHPTGERTPLTRPFLGKEYAQERMRTAIGTLPHEVYHSKEALVRQTASLLARQKIIAWFQGKSEFGPRALGHRSVLADPRQREMKDILNMRVKHRESFRPFAPSVLQERAREYFELDVASPFMLFVSPIRPSRLHEIPAIAHIDNTARLQTVSLEMDELFHLLLAAFGEITGVPVVLNTSFNMAGDPIVETPEDAVHCFLATDLDYLVMGPFLVHKVEEGVAPLSNGS